VECDEFDWKKTNNGAQRLDGTAVDDSDGDESMSEVGNNHMWPAAATLNPKL
jgi:hypothetical protein